MTGFNNNMSMNNSPIMPNLGKKQSEINKANINSEKNDPKLMNDQSAQQLKPAPNQSIVNTNSNVTINQQVLNSPAVNQTALNTVNIPQPTLNQDIKNPSNAQVQSTPVQGEFKGASDLPAYAGIANMSLKSWVAQNDNFQGRASNTKTPLTTLLEAIQGFEEKSYEEESEDGVVKKLKDTRSNKRKNLILLSSVFSSEEQSGCNETEVIVNISSFKKLGSKTGDRETSDDESIVDFKQAPPAPSEVEKPVDLNDVKIAHLRELFALPKELPVALRLFAGEHKEINPQYFKSFIHQRMKIVKENLFSDNMFLNDAFQSFVPLLEQAEKHLLITFLLLYYPLPFPVLKNDFDFANQWKLKKDKKNKDIATIATCDIYYVSKTRGKFLIKLELFENSDLSVSVQTARENNGIAKDIELGIEESMLLLESPPKLSELNVLLTGEIYNATDINEELSIISTGPLRLEIIMAAYSALSILNRLKTDPDPSGLIEMLD